MCHTGPCNTSCDGVPETVMKGVTAALQEVYTLKACTRVTLIMYLCDAYDATLEMLWPSHRLRMQSLEFANSV